MLPATCIEVSVIVPVYNGERHLAEAIRSILEHPGAGLLSAGVDSPRRPRSTISWNGMPGR